jgi:G3E family GTPase
MCCSAAGPGDELERVLDSLLRGASVGASAASGAAPSSPAPLPFDYVVVETSGAVDPAPLLQVLMRTEGLRLDGVITVVDAAHVGLHLDERRLLSRAREAGQQVAYADVVLLNKADAASEAQKAEAAAAIADINPTARIIPTAYCDVDTRLLLDARAFDVHRAGRLLAEQQGATGGTSSRGAPAVAARHTPHLRTITLAAGGEAGGQLHPVSCVALQAWLRRLLAAQWQRVLRVKGLLWVRDDTADGSGADAGSNADAADTSPQRSHRRARRRRTASARGRDSDSAESDVPGARARLYVLQGVHAELHGGFADEDTETAAAITASSARGAEAGSTDACSGACGVSGPDHDHSHTPHRLDRSRRRVSPRDAVASGVHPHGNKATDSASTSQWNAQTHRVDEGVQTGLVIIGRDLDEAALRQSFSEEVLATAP